MVNSSQLVSQPSADQLAQEMGDYMVAFFRHQLRDGKDSHTSVCEPPTPPVNFDSTLIEEANSIAQQLAKAFTSPGKRYCHT